MKIINIALLVCFLLITIWGCQKDELPIMVANSSLNSQIAGKWNPVKHQLEYFLLNETIVQRGKDTVLVYERDSINGKWAFYNSVPCDTLIFNANGTWTINNRRKVDANSGKDLKWTDTTKTVAGAKTTILIKNRYWEITDIASQGSNDYGKPNSFLRMSTQCTQTVKEAAKSDIVTKWRIINKVFTIVSAESNTLTLGYQSLMNISYRPGVLPTQPPQKINRYVTNTITFSK